MKCPSCDETLLMSDKNGVEIDYCPKCRGIWLDRGELDKILERSAAYESDSQKGNYSEPDRGYSERDRNYRDERRPYKKKKSFLDDLFDF